MFCDNDEFHVFHKKRLFILFQVTYNCLIMQDLLLLSYQPRVTVTSCFVYKVLGSYNQ